MKPIAIIVIAAVAGISLFLLASASTNTDIFAELFPYLIALNGAVAVVLGGVVAVQLRRLWRQYKRREFGSRLKYRLLLMFALMAVVPGVVVYAVSLQFVVRSIDSWFDVRVERALDGGIALGQNALDYLVDQVGDRGREMALELDGTAAVSTTRLNRLREQAGVATATVIDSGGQLVATVSDGVSAFLPDLPSTMQMRQARQSQRFQTVETRAEGMMIRVVVPIRSRSFLAEPAYLQLTQPVPPSLVSHFDAVQEAHREYQQLVLGREGLSHIYSMTLTLTLLLSLLAAVAVAVLLSRRFAAPLLILAEGTKAVAQGDYSPRQALPARDELGVLTQSFNQMTRQLEEARAQAEKNRAAVDAARAYLESVLANLSTGVLAFDAEGFMRAANRGAIEILDDKLEGFEAFALAQWPRHAQFRDTMLAGFRDNEGDWHQQLEIAVPDSAPQTLLIHGARLPEQTGGGYVVVFDDISELARAQRTAAWAEVARRLAHEIKNPLTPIQLSAERLAYKLDARLDEPGREILERATRTIVNQVEAMKNLVNAFREYSKLPSPSLQSLDLNALVADVLTLYEHGSVRIDTQFQPDLPPVLGDAAQIRQILHNLMQNAQDALTESSPDSARIVVSTHEEGEWIMLQVCDNGPGFPAELFPRAFEPYFTTKSRGTGLGLAIIKKIVDEHGGRVRLRNAAEGGAVVRIRLRPAQPRAQSANDDKLG